MGVLGAASEASSSALVCFFWGGAASEASSIAIALAGTLDNTVSGTFLLKIWSDGEVGHGSRATSCDGLDIPPAFIESASTGTADF